MTQLPLVNPPYVQVDRCTRRFVYPERDAIALHDWAIRRNHVATMKAASEPDHLEVTVIRDDGWERPKARKERA